MVIFLIANFDSTQTIFKYHVLNNFSWIFFIIFWLLILGDESTEDNLWQGIEFINTEEGKYCQDYKRGDYGTDLKCQRQCEEWNSCIGISVSHPTKSCYLCKKDILEVAPWGIKDWVFRQPKGNVIENDFYKWKDGFFTYSK